MADRNSFLFEAPLGELADAMAHKTLKRGKKNKDAHEKGTTRDKGQRVRKAERDAATLARIRASRKRQVLADILQRIRNSNLSLGSQQNNDELLRQIRDGLAQKQRGFQLDAALQSARITLDELIAFLKQNGAVAEYMFEVQPVSAESDAEFGQWLRKTLRAAGLAAGIGFGTLPNPHLQSLGKAVAAAVTGRTKEGDQARQRAARARSRDRGGAGR